MFARKTLMAVAALMAVSGAQLAHADENGNQHYPIGVNTLMDGFLPPPGTLQYYDYVQWSNDSHQVDANGHRSATPVNSQAVANAFRVMYTWTPQIGPFHYTTGLVLPLVHVDLDAAGKRGSDFGTGDITFQNYLGSSNASHTFFYFFGLDTYLPTGHYDRSAMVNTGNNYYTFAPNVNFSYVPNDRWEFSAVLFLNYNTTNHATDYHSGDAVDSDFGITWRPFDSLPKLGIGVQGFYYKQFTDDTQYGQRVDGDGYRGQVAGLGPQLRYDFAHGGIALKYQRDFAVENRMSGNALWFQFSLPLYQPSH